MIKLKKNFFNLFLIQPIARPHIKDSGDVDISATDASLKIVVNLGKLVFSLCLLVRYSHFRKSYKNDGKVVKFSYGKIIWILTIL